ncbi:sigma-70 family rna polymerase sigma factor : RNA polymerase, sigma-24 subunit, ECF subfamily OS=Isosphaera pallida (strain ATCC 43644 / DSM 9630 / IS1B) GN=Isop_2781 PE=4 SV=1: Sigma70_ECF [Gemmata massiliana]|uniref:RNA polymerase sigma-70 ECF-like HTH domain-containing protein n=1 Tax=Gemmata massiliana TaxID=1210884 RepID=A0A6P2DGN6_9BACT|nr:sigma-70 family RNA polymerase sigma factor [Gemmata massiliana]VTS00945.1 sigma-70 family rna polymerase sigma factor : RNA polymerase, sigma-24 subunit, ECF subfamily OS=Isosphaera pallida (strain ATCC 43644 / DSM 9630 / IS1B) GN=Isop_2781 PE=4 SV=1: Sigma70_ECF [Gemmata massiliana]
MSGNDDLLSLLEACRRRDPAATAELVRRYLPHVRAAVRRRLATGMRMRFDSQDFAQDVWLSFFRAAIDREDLRDEGGLVAYLSQMARLKVAEEYRHQTTQKVGLNRDVPVSQVSDPTGRDPTPSQMVVADDEWERLTAGLSDRERQMLQMLRDGHTHADTAAMFQLSEKTVQRLVRRLLSRGTSPGTPP